MPSNILLNWKTSAAGLSVGLLGASNILHALSVGQMPNTADIGLVITGIMGLVAKDASVTGTAK